ncbi:SprT-like domain-containing protein [Salinisphaera sp. T31B1]|uniref:SprT family zinc-dependent metalloprotease n=1 Tax=Salinisphaera sp. T31B1 TaxID=727963 RepID=UPI003341709A
MTDARQHELALEDGLDLQTQAIRRTAYWIERARTIFEVGPRRLPVPDVRFDLKGRAAGQAVFARRSRQIHIRINAALLASHPHEMLDDTVPHEVAHVVVFRLYGRRAKPHGHEWKTLMRAFGVDPAPCHTLPAEPSRQLKRFRYECGCDEPAWLTSIRHKRARQGTDYICRRCGQTLKAAEQQTRAG